MNLSVARNTRTFHYNNKIKSPRKNTLRRKLINLLLRKEGFSVSQTEHGINPDGFNSNLNSLRDDNGFIIKIIGKEPSLKRGSHGCNIYNIVGRYSHSGTIRIFTFNS